VAGNPCSALILADPLYHSLDLPRPAQTITNHSLDRPRTHAVGQKSHYNVRLHSYQKEALYPRDALGPREQTDSPWL